MSLKNDVSDIFIIYGRVNPFNYDDYRGWYLTWGHKLMSFKMINDLNDLLKAWITYKTINIFTIKF